MVGLELAEDAADVLGQQSSSIHLPITVVITHPTALSHFVDFLSQVGGQNYIDFYLAIEVGFSKQKYNL